MSQMLKSKLLARLQYSVPFAKPITQLTKFPTGNTIRYFQPKRSSARRQRSPLVKINELIRESLLFLFRANNNAFSDHLNQILILRGLRTNRLDKQSPGKLTKRLGNWICHNFPVGHPSAPHQSFGVSILGNRRKRQRNTEDHSSETNCRHLHLHAAGRCVGRPLVSTCYFLEPLNCTNAMSLSPRHWFKKQHVCTRVT